MRGPLVSADEALALLADGARFVDATWRLADGAASGRADFDAAHVPDAVFFDIDAIADENSDLPHMLPAPEAFAAAVGAMGIGTGDAVVVYDQDGVLAAARVWWTFKAMGCERVVVLDGGLPAWRAAGGALASGPTRPRRTPYEAAFEAGRVAGLDAVLAALEAGGLVLDARPADRFAGAAAEPRPGLASGAMPGASSLPATALVENGRLLEAARLDAALREACWTPEAATVTTCGSGVAASLLALAIEAAAGRPAAVYDGSWAEWGRGVAPDGRALPIVSRTAI